MIDDLTVYNRDNFKSCRCLECGRAIDLVVARDRIPLGFDVVEALKYFDAITNYCRFESAEPEQL